jgi:hypothetical protein
MALQLPPAERRTTRVLKDAIDDIVPLLRLDEGRRDKSGQWHLRRSRPVPVYTFAAADLVAPYRRLSELRDAPDGWRFLLRHDKRSWLADLRAAGGGVTLNQVLGGAQAERFAAAHRYALRTVKDDAQLRLIRLASARMEALWLAGKTDRFVDLSFDGEPILCGIEMLIAVVRRRV